MMHVDSVRDFLDRYNEGRTYEGRAKPSEGDRPSSLVRDHQADIGRSPDEHVIPRSQFQYRTGPIQADTQSADAIRTSENMHLVELYWDTLVGSYGLDAFTAYVPFHEDESAFGIYISQRGIRYLGHLLYHWSKVSVDGGSTRETLSGLRIDAGDPQSSQPSAFDSLDSAFELAEELLIRYQWFHHQIELLGAYLEDIYDVECYSTYHQQYRKLNSPNALTSRAVGNLYVSRSHACRTRAPKSIYPELLSRALESFDPPTDRLRIGSVDGFDDGRREISSALRQAATRTHAAEVKLAGLFPLTNDVSRAVPRKIAVYITRSESDPNHDSWTNRPGFHSLNPSRYAIRRSDRFERAYEKYDQTIKQQIDKTVQNIREKYDQQYWKGVTEGPDDMRYIDVTGKVRLIVQVDEDANEVELVEVGKHDLPAKYDLYKST